MNRIDIDLTAKKIYMVDDIAKILNISQNTAYKLVKSNVFKSVKIGSQYRISKKSFDYWLNGGGENGDS